MAKKIKSDFASTFSISSIVVNDWRLRNIIDPKLIPTKELISFTASPYGRVQVDKKEITVGFKVKCSNNQSEEEIFYIDAFLSFVFNKEFDSVIEAGKDNKTVKISPQVSPTLISIAYSTIRGIISERTLGTFMSSIPLPVVNPNSFFKTKVGE